MRLIIGLVFFVLLSVHSMAQQPLELLLEQRGEVVVLVDNMDLLKIEDISTFSVEPKSNGHSLVYLNQAHYHQFLELGIPFVPEIAPSLRYSARMAGSKKELENWDAYPSYEAYLEMMQAFADDYPNICMIDTIGLSQEGRLLIAVKISDNVSVDENEPEFFYTSSMHGDELTGFVLMLRLIDYLLNNPDDEQVQRLISNLEIFINPLANPDGAYRYDNSTVSGATRFNINGVDLNRNFPDPKGGDHPDGKEWQVETIAMMDYMKMHNFNMSMNLHGGAEVINYPWDTFSRRHADDEWFKLICREFADLAHEVDPNYLTDLDNGITNGYDWYSVEGGRQDYVTYFLQGREVIGEISSEKLPDASLLPGFWDKTYKSFLAYMENAIYGVTGQVTDQDGNTLSAKITVVDHDKDSSFVYTVEEGTYYRYLKAGTHSFMFETEGYENIQVDGVEVIDYESTVLNVQFKKEVSAIVSDLGAVKVYPNPTNGLINVEIPVAEIGYVSIQITNALGRSMYSENISTQDLLQINTQGFDPGIYYLSLKYSEQMLVKKIVIQK